MAALLGAREVMCALAAALAQEGDLPFACALVQALNLVLLTAPEVGRLPGEPRSFWSHTCQLERAWPVASCAPCWVLRSAR